MQIQLAVCGKARGFHHTFRRPPLPYHFHLGARTLLRATENAFKESIFDVTHSQITEGFMQNKQTLKPSMENTRDSKNVE